MISETDVCIVGAGLSGLTAAHRLTQAGLDDLVVVEARSRVGGRTVQSRTPGGRIVQSGGIHLGPAMTRLMALIDEFEMPIVEHAEEGAVVAVQEGKRVVQTLPFEDEPAAAADLDAAFAAFAAIVDAVPAQNPWAAPGAQELDAQTAATWIAANVADSRIQALLAESLEVAGAGARELSLLYVAWLVRTIGGFDTLLTGLTHFVKSGELVERLAAELGPRILLDAPVRHIAYNQDGVVVTTDRGVMRARAAIVAIAPHQAAAIDWRPALPVARAVLQNRFAPMYGVKLWAFYDEPFWLADGLSGMALGAEGLTILPETRPDGTEGILTASIGALTPSIAEHARLVDHPDELKHRFLRAAETCFGPQGAAPVDLHLFRHYGDAWSPGVVSSLPPGVLSMVGPALDAPVGPIVWAGAEASTSYHGWLEGAVSAAERAVETVCERLGGASR